MKLPLATLLAWIALTFAGSTHAGLINIAPTGSATVSGTWVDGADRWIAEHAIDGDVGTIWNSGSFAPQWIEIDLGRRVLIEGISALIEQFPPGFSRHIVSLDGVNQFTWEGETNTGQWLSHDFLTPVSAQVVRIRSVVSPSWIAWREIQIFTAEIPLAGTLWLLVPGLPLLLLARRKRASLGYAGG